MEFQMDDQLAAVLSSLFPSASNPASKRPSDKKLLQSFIEDQYKADDDIQTNRKKKPQKKKEEFVDPVSDEELKAQLENAVRKYKKNKRKKEPEPNAKPVKRETEPWENESYVGERTENSVKKGTNGDGDASSDLMELVNFFFAPQKDEYSNGHMKSYSEYEKQGAIPKRIARSGSKNAKSLNLLPECKSKEKNSKGELPISKQTTGEQVVKFSEEACSRPFFYIVPENPSPEFFLPRGSYYVVPKVPGPLADSNIVFHPEKSSQPKKRDAWGIQPNLKPPDPLEINNLSKEVQQKMDSHLNIGPFDVKGSDSSSNLEINYDENKIYEKVCVRNSENGFASPETTLDDAICIELTLEEERLTAIERRLNSEFPDISLSTLERFAEKYVNDEAGLESFILSEREKRNIAAQFERLVLALPDSNAAELRMKCNEFKGDETLEAAYIANVRSQNKVLQHVLVLQHIFPDADPDFLRQNVEELNCNGEAISMFTNVLLESQDYPKISDEHQSMEKTRLWNKYVRHFNVKEYLREVREPQNFAGALGNNKQDTGLVYKYLQARYPLTALHQLEASYALNSNNLTKTCASLNKSQTIGMWKNSFEKENYTEDFLREVAYIEFREKIDLYVDEIMEQREIEREDALENDCFLSCPLCSDSELVASEVVTCPEGHVFCETCVIRYVTVKVSDGVYNFVCPFTNCKAFFTLKTLEELVSETVLLNIIKKQQAEEISIADVEGLESCPYCEFAYIPNPSDKIFKCGNPACLIETCRNCKEKSHIPLRCNEIERPVDLEARKKIEETMTEKLLRVCPKCKKKIVKIDGCNKMQCTCGTLFCYICQQMVTGYEHFNRNNFGKGCPLYSNNESLHNADVVQAGIRARDEILLENPNIRLMNDPTQL